MDVMEAIRRRRSVREYLATPIPPKVLEEVTEALRLAPSACNNQPWRFIIVTDKEQRLKVAQACNGQLFVAGAPVLIVGCAVPEMAYPRMGGYWNTADIDVAIAMDHLTLAATEAGLGSCWIGAFDEKAIKALLQVPEPVKVVAMMMLGYPAMEGVLRTAGHENRKGRHEVFSENRF